MSQLFRNKAHNIYVMCAIFLHLGSCWSLKLYILLRPFTVLEDEQFKTSCVKTKGGSTALIIGRSALCVLVNPSGFSLTMETILK